MAVARSVEIGLVVVRVEGRGFGGKEWGREERTVVTSPDREEDLANVHTSNASIGLAPSSTHSSLQSIGTGT